LWPEHWPSSIKNDSGAIQGAGMKQILAASVANLLRKGLTITFSYGSAEKHLGQRKLGSCSENAVSEQVEYKIEETRDGAFIVSGPVTDSRPRFEVREKALAFCRYAIGGRAGGGFIRVVTADGNSSRELFQGTRNLSQSYSAQRQG
jgi:hypothetical protein